MRRFDRSFLEPKRKPLHEFTHQDLVDHCEAVLRPEREALIHRIRMRDASMGWPTHTTPCPTPRPAGAHDAEQRTRGDAPSNSERLT